MALTDPEAGQADADLNVASSAPVVPAPVDAVQADLETDDSPVVERIAAATADIRKDAGAAAPDEVQNHPGKWLVVSCIRHGQCIGNVDTSDTSLDSPLTAYGREQVAELGKAWANVRIDKIFTSDLVRAKDTAQALIDHHTTPVELEETELLREQDIGPRARMYLAQGNSRLYRQELGGTSFNVNPNRTAVPTGGESLNMVQLRVLLTIVDLHREAVALKEPPPEFLKPGPTNPEDVPEGVPHIVLTSHNVYLLEFYEFMLGGFDRQTEHVWAHHVHYKNTDWSRHILWFSEESGLKGSKHADLRVPRAPIW